MIAKQTVSLGIKEISSGGLTLTPSQLYFFGIISCSAKALL
jgi:hypothetical protein